MYIAQKVEEDLWFKPNSFWKYTNRYRKHSKHVPVVEVDSDLISAPWVVCKKFKEYFASVYQSPMQDDVNTDLQDPSYHELSVVSSPNISTTDVESATKGLKVRTAVGIAGIPLLKVTDEIFAPVLISVFNWSLTS